MTQIEVFISNPSLVEMLAKFLCDELDVTPSRLQIVPFEIDDSGDLGLCLDESDDEFIVFVKEKDRNIGEVFTTIAHEMIHVKQYMKENLNWFLHNHKDIPYMDRWWEKEAFANAVPLVTKFANTIKEMS
jgi:hypothetical protein